VLYLVPDRPTRLAREPLAPLKARLIFPRLDNHRIKTFHA
jgi:hypothetical protein